MYIVQASFHHVMICKVGTRHAAPAAGNKQSQTVHEIDLYPKQVLKFHIIGQNSSLCLQILFFK